MAKIIYIFFFVFHLNNLAFSQNIDLNKLIELRQLSFEKINEKLLNQAWEFENSSKSEPDSLMAEVTWVYLNKRTLTNSILVLNLSNESENRLYFVTSDKIIYNNIMKEINGFNMKIIKTSIADNKVTTYYQGKNYVIRVMLKPDRYNFAIFKKEDYLFLLEKGQIK